MTVMIGTILLSCSTLGLCRCLCFCWTYLSLFVQFAIAQYSSGYETHLNFEQFNHHKKGKDWEKEIMNIQQEMTSTYTAKAINTTVWVARNVFNIHDDDELWYQCSQHDMRRTTA